MPEGDTIYRAARTLHRVLSGEVVTRFQTQLPKLARVQVEGRIIEKVEPHGKWLLIHFSGDLILLTHMLMNGSWHIYRPGERWQRRATEMRIVIQTKNILAIAFRVQIADFHSAESVLRRKGFHNLGPDLLSESFDEEEVRKRLLEMSEEEIGVALLKQHIVAGIGNLYKSEICFACGINPFDRIGTLNDSAISCLIATAHTYLYANVAQGLDRTMLRPGGPRTTTGRIDPAAALWVYRRAGQPCRKCGTLIQSRKQGTDARTTFWCAGCQPDGISSPQKLARASST